MDPESVKEAIASRAVTEGTKKKLVEIYDRFCRQHGFTWNRPRYRGVERLPHIPLESEIDQLIGALSRRVRTFLQLI